MGQSLSGNKNCFEEERMDRYKEIAPWLGEFDEADWFSEAIDITVRGLKDSDSELFSMFPTFHDKLYCKEGVASEKTDWFLFQESVKEHQELAMKDLDVLYKEKMGLDLHQM
jgi:hypothetical protein